MSSAAHKGKRDSQHYRHSS